MKKVIFILFAVLEQVSCMNTMYGEQYNENSKQFVEGVYLRVSFPVASKLICHQLENFVTENGGRIEYLSPTNFASNTRWGKESVKIMKKKTVVSPSDDFDRINETMIFAQGKLERFLSGFGDKNFRSSVLTSVRSDIEVLEDEFTHDSLIILPCVKTVMDLLEQCEKQQNNS